MTKVGFIGLGHNGIGHIEAHKRVGKSEIAALCDMNPERLKSASEKFGVEKTYSSADELCKQEDIDAISINTGDQFHMEPFLSALENEKHIDRSLISRSPIEKTENDKWPRYEEAIKPEEKQEE